MRINISDLSRRTSVIGKAVYKDVGLLLSQHLWKEFERLVNETPQYTGTTAASWNIAFGASSGGVREQPKRTRKTALRKGHQAAVQIALSNNAGNLDNIMEKYRYADLSIWNDAPFVDRAEKGPLRAVNEPARRFEAFKIRVTDITLTLGNYNI